MKIQLNEQQKLVYKNIKKFLNVKCKKNKILLLGPSGSGKTTVITSTLMEVFGSEKINSVCFCAFTNKATKVLQDMILKLFHHHQESNEIPLFMTIHTLLKLEPKTIDMTSVGSKKLLKKLKEDRNKNIYNWESLKYLLDEDLEYQKLKNKNKKTRREKTKDEKIEDLLMFSYDYRKLDDLIIYDVIVIDECSTVSRELYLYLESTLTYIMDKFNHRIKIIFLGDYYQLPPVSESKSIVFQKATIDKWAITKLSKVMRSKTTQIDEINNNFLTFINTKLKKRKLNIDDINTPYSIIPYDTNTYMNDLITFHKKYVAIPTEDKIIITYSNKNCYKTNVIIQNLIDRKNKITREPDPVYKPIYANVPTMIWFKEGDRLMIHSPIIVPQYIVKDIDMNIDMNWRETTETCYLISNIQGKIKIYNGDIFIVESQKKIKIKTVLNIYENFSEIPPYFNGQLLSCKVFIGDEKNTNKEHTTQFTLLHVDTLEVEKARRILKKNIKHKDYVDTMSLFRKNFTTLKRGYCMTCYKTQGSEFEHVFVNLKSFWASLLNKNNVRLLFSAFYTASTRSSNKLILYW